MGVCAICRHRALVGREALEQTAGIITAATNMPPALPVAPFEPLRDGNAPRDLSH